MGEWIDRGRSAGPAFGEQVEGCCPELAALIESLRAARLHGAAAPLPRNAEERAG